MGEGKLVMCQLTSGVCVARRFMFFLISGVDQSISGMDRIHAGVGQSHLSMRRIRSAMSGSHPGALQSRPTFCQIRVEAAPVLLPGVPDGDVACEKADYPAGCRLK